MIELFKKSEYYLLVEEGGEGTLEHYHLHGIISSGYKRSNNFRAKVLKPIFEEIGKELTPVGIRITCVTHLQGALSYIYKDKRVLCSVGIMLDSIKPWISTPKKWQLKGCTMVNKHNYVRVVTDYCDRSGRSPVSWFSLRYVMQAI